MGEGLLCIVCIFMVLWLLLLMSENRGLKNDVAKLKGQLRDQLEKNQTKLEIGAGRKLTAAELNRVNRSALHPS